MSYAVKNNGSGWRAVNSVDDVCADEYFSETIPEKTNAQLMAEELSSLAATYKSDTLQYQLNWLTATVSEGASEAGKKVAISQYLADLKTKYVADMAAVKSKYA